MSDKSLTLAKEIGDGTLTLSKIEGCAFNLRIDPNPICLTFSQLFLLTKAEPDKAPFEIDKYLCYAAPLGFVSKTNEAMRAEYTRQFVEVIVGRLAKQFHVRGTRLPAPEGRGDLGDKRRILEAIGSVAKDEPLSDVRVQQLYRTGIEQTLEKHARRLNARFGSTGVEWIPEDFIQPAKAVPRIQGVLFPGPFQPFPSKYPKVALVARFAQCWEQVGYTRGDLINSFSLAPGEQLTLEYHYWDKTTRKSEEELSKESELKLTNSLTQRDSSELLSEVFGELGSKLDGRLSATIPIPVGEVPIPVGVNFGGEVGSKVSSKLQSSVKSSVDSVIEASNTFRQTHRVRVEVTRETGREEKQTRVIANTNRCHTLNCLYFEILSNYVVSTHFVDFDACLLVEFDKPRRIDTKFVLCYEGVLRNVLLDRTYIAGFAAAKLIETDQFLRPLKRRREKAEAKGAAAAGPPGGTGGTTPADPLGRHVTNILRDFDEVSQAADEILNLLQDIDLGALAGEMVESPVKFRRLLYWGIIQLNTNATGAVRGLQRANADGVVPRDALQDFFSIATSRDYESNVVTATLRKALDALGIPRDIVNVLVLGYINFLDLVADDAGLYESVRAAEEAMGTSLALPPLPTPAAGVPATAPVVSTATVDEISLLELAEAYVEFDRLKCHIRANEPHYLQAVFHSVPPDARAEILQARGVSGIVRNEIVGFFDGNALFPLVDSRALIDLLKENAKTDISQKSLNDFITELADDVENSQEPRLVTIPTPATYMEAFVGECEGCEGYIVQSRDIDLHQQQAKAALDEAEVRYKDAKTQISATEALRIDKRIRATPPDLSDPIQHSAASIDVRVTSDSDGG